MPADESLDQQPVSVLVMMLAARYPLWTIWFGQATRHWWALPSYDRDANGFVEAADVKELVESIEVIQARRHLPPSPAPAGGILFGEATASRAGRPPAAVWLGGQR